MGSACADDRANRTTDAGGDAACWLDRVCDRCGMIDDELEAPHVCRRPAEPSAHAAD
jgi:hypothetical protein